MTVHYSFRLEGTAERAREVVALVRQRAVELGFGRVSEVLEVGSQEAMEAGKGMADWLEIAAARYVEVGEGEERESVGVRPSEAVAFYCSPGVGCEASPMGLGRYPKIVEARVGGVDVEVVTGVGDGWRWLGHCKTQYASNPRDGGLENFCACHLRLVGLLDYAKQLGIVADVQDEGGYWEQRDRVALEDVVQNYNRLMAGFVGSMKDMLGRLGRQAVGPITDYPNYEHLEAEGRDPRRQRPER